MRLFLSLVFLFLGLFINAEALASNSPVDGFVTISKGRELYVNYVPPQENMPTVILLNGLTYSTAQWYSFSETLIAKGVGVLRYDPMGMGRTLLRYAPILAPISYQDQIVDLKLLLDKMNIPGPYNLVGLSYGGGIAAGFTERYPELINNLIMMAPFTRPLDDTDNWIKGQMWLARKLYPYLVISDDDLYDFYLRQIVYTTYPQAEPVVLENPFKLEATFRLVQGIRKARPVDHTDSIPARALHLMIARQDQYIKAEVLEEYWDAVPAGARASRLYINGSEHKMVEAVPYFTASWVYEIVTGNKNLFKGKSFEGYPMTDRVCSDESHCLNLGK